MFKTYRIQIDEDPIFVQAWRNFISHIISASPTYGTCNELLREYDAYLLAIKEDYDYGYPLLNFKDVDGYMLFMLRWC
jgi:hypothetical protein